ncbi:MAG: type II secretion system F family protein [Thermoguttaceae bacterium]|jgi:tight adherence protein B
MLHPLLIAIAAFVGVAALVGGAALLWLGRSGNRIEYRLDTLTGAGATTSGKDNLLKENTILTRPLDEGVSFLQRMLERFGDITLLFEQADTSLSVSQLAMIALVLMAAGALLAMLLRVPAALVPVAGLLPASLPLLWVLVRRKRRMQTFAAQLPDALEMLARTLRSGQSLGFGFNIVANEVGPPLGREFSRIFEEQNLGIPMEESLENMTRRVPNIDLRFFVTSVILQRQTGGDLAEILDKIGRLIRERFQIWGQVKALTGEGRLSGIVLLALPFVLFLAVYRLDPHYVSMLFTDPAGKKMLAAGLVMQVLGALVIRKIVNIRV